MTITNKYGRFITWLSIVMLCAALVVTTERWRSSRQEIARSQETIKAQERAIASNRRGLTELCRTNAIVRGLVTEQLEIQRATLDTGSIPPKLLPRFKLGISVIEGYRDQLDQQTACEEVTQP